MKSERIDHVHIKVSNLQDASKVYEKVLGTEIPSEIDCTASYGMKVVFNPFPNGIELMEVTDTSKEMAALYNDAPDGVFALSLKVANLDEASSEMEKMGYKQLMRYEFGEIKEALFDTKKDAKVYIELVEYLTENIADADYDSSNFEMSKPQ